MRINKVIATDCVNKGKQIFTFGTAGQGKEIVTSMGGHLNAYLDFCFKEESENLKDVEVVFTLDNDEFSMSRIHNEDGTTRQVLKKKVDGHWQVVARNKNALSYVEAIVQEQIADLLKINYVNNIAIQNFHGDLMLFDQIKMLTEVKDEILKSSSEARARQQTVNQRVKEYAMASVPPLSTEKLEAVNGELDALSRDITVVTAQLGELRARQTASSLHIDIAKKLEEAQQKYKLLVDNQDEIEEARKKILLRDEVAMLVPKIKTLQLLEQQRAEYEKKRYAITTELEWQENELGSVNKQLDEKQQQFALSQDKRTRIETINNELSNVAQLYEENKRLNENLLELNDKQQRLLGERGMYVNKLSSIEKSLGEVKDSLDAFNIPAKSVGELLETVRIDVKIDEVNSQIEKLQSEIKIKDSQIAEKESALVLQVKRFRSVAELDVAVTPIKAKDTILQVLDAKYSKLETINLSLAEKQRNLERAMEDYKYRIIQLENSRSKLEAERNKALLRKQEEFKREVFLNSQKVYTDDATGVFAVTANFQDQEIETLDQEIRVRNADRDQLVERAAQLEGAIREIRRNIEINSAEMETLMGEKQNINNRYNEIIAQNSSEVVFNYLKALNNDNGTKYLLDVQQDAVRSEAELTELKRYNESLRSKVSALKSRLRHLKETQSQFDGAQMTVDSLVSTNDRLKEDLTDIGERLSAGYEQYISVCRQLESVNSKLEDVGAAIIEAEKTIKLNEAQIAQSTEKAKKLAGSDDLEQAVANFKYELGDVESERQMLVESKQAIEKEVFKKRLELEKMQWLYDTKCAERDELRQELQLELNVKGLDVEQITTMNFDDPKLDLLRKEIAEYDAVKSNLAEKIENYYGILKDEDLNAVSDKQVEEKKKEVEALLRRQSELEKLRQQHLNNYVLESNAKMRVTAAAAEARTFASLKQTINHNEIIGLLVADKVKATMSVATQYFNVLTNTNYVLLEQDGKVVVNKEGENVAYDDLDEATQTAVYVSLILAVPNTDVTEGKWLVFEERINIDKKVLSKMLLNMDNISYVVKFSREQAPKAAGGAE